jgi:hypothetical protein
MRFTIRDVLWLMVVVALIATLWLNQQSVRKERVSWARERDAIKTELGAEIRSIKREFQTAKRGRDNFEQLARHYETELVTRIERDRWQKMPESQRELAKQQSAQLGAPQPSPFPTGFGETPN